MAHLRSYLLALWVDLQTPSSPSTLTPCALAGFPEVDREAQALSPLLSDPGDPTPAVRRWECRCRVWAALRPPSFLSSEHETQRKWGCRSQRQPAPPPSPWGLLHDLSHQEPSTCPQSTCPCKAPHGKQDPHPDPIWNSSPASSSPPLSSSPSLSSHLPFPSFTEPPSVAGTSWKDAIFRASNQNGAWCTAGFRIQTDSAGGHTASGATFLPGLTLLFFH